MTNLSVNNFSLINNLSKTISSNAISSKTAMPPEMQTALNAIQGLGLQIEVCGAWIWIFDTDASHETQLRAVGFTWSHRRGCWYLCPQAKDTKTNDNASSSNRQSWGMDKVRKVFGSQVITL